MRVNPAFDPKPVASGKRRKRKAYRRAHLRAHTAEILKERRGGRKG